MVLLFHWFTDYPKLQACFFFYKLSVHQKSTCRFWNHLIVRNFLSPSISFGVSKWRFNDQKASSLRTCVGRMMSLRVSLWTCRPIFSEEAFSAEKWPAPKECIFVRKKNKMEPYTFKIQDRRNANDEEEIFPRCKSDIHGKNCRAVNSRKAQAEFPH